jgi:uncharacterized membrane protein
MRPRTRHGASGQTIVIAAIAMVAVVGGLAMVIDAGMFFVIQRQLQSAADAGALAGAWYQPICLTPPGCRLSPPTAQSVAQSVARANAETIKGLCGGNISVPPPASGTPLNLPRNVNAIVVTVECDAPYTFGRILGLTTPKHISASAAAAIGDRDANGDMTDFTTNPVCPDPDKCRIARLIE